MISKRLIAAAMAGLLVVGCTKQEEKTTTKTDTTAVPGATGSTPATLPSMGQMTDTAKTAMTQPSAAMDKAKDLLAQVGDYVKQNKLDAADEALTKLEGMKGQLPQGMQDQIAALRTQLNTLKSAKLPAGIPGLPGSK